MTADVNRALVERAQDVYTFTCVFERLKQLSLLRSRSACEPALVASQSPLAVVTEQYKLIDASHALLY